MTQKELENGGLTWNKKVVFFKFPKNKSIDPCVSKSFKFAITRTAYKNNMNVGFKQSRSSQEICK